MTAPGSAETEHHPWFTVHGSRPRDTLAELGIVVDLIFHFFKWLAKRTRVREKRTLVSCNRQKAVTHVTAGSRFTGSRFTLLENSWHPGGMTTLASRFTVLLLCVYD